MAHITDGLFQMLRFLQHHFQRPLEHIDMRLENIDELSEDERELALETAHALVEGVEFTHGYLLLPFAALGHWKLELASLPTPAGPKTVAALAFEAAAGMARALGLPARQRLLFDGAFLYLASGSKISLWLELTAEGAVPLQQPKLPIVS
jgi:hypothetical protein